MVRVRNTRRLGLASGSGSGIIKAKKVNLKTKETARYADTANI